MNFTFVAIGWVVATILVYMISNFTRHGPDGMAAWIFVTFVGAIIYALVRKR